MVSKYCNKVKVGAQGMCGYYQCLYQVMEHQL
jgi:hypothetical protein